VNFFEARVGVERTSVAVMRVKVKKNKTLNDFKPDPVNNMPAILFVRFSYMQLANVLKTPSW
jgi:hypothetical protein